MTLPEWAQEVELLEITSLLGYHTGRSVGGLCCGREDLGSYTEPDNQPTVQPLRGRTAAELVR